MSQLHPQISNSEDSSKVAKEAEKLFSDYFNELVKKANIDTTANKETSSKFYKLADSTSKLEKSKKWKNIFKWLFIWLIIPFFVLNNQIKKMTPKIDEQNKELDELETKLKKQLAPLYALYSTSGVLDNVLNKAFEDFQFAPTISDEHAPLWENFDNSVASTFPKDKDFSVSNVVSGEIFSSPFIVAQGKIQSWISVPYTAEVPISYEADKGYGTDIAIATVFWPYPVYKINDYMAIKTNLVRGLSFINKATHKFSLFKKKDKDQLPMDNPEFDKKFPCARNDEKDFRVAFTVLTQEKIVKLLETYPDFVLCKDNDNVFTFQRNSKFELEKYTICRNSFRKNKNQNFNELDASMNNSGISYSFGSLHKDSSYDVDEIKQMKLDQITNFIERFAKIQTPITCLPLFYREDYKITKPNKLVCSSVQTEAYAESIYKRVYRDNKFETNVIIKTQQDETIRISKSLYGFISKVVIKYFYSVPKPVPAVAISAHGSRPTTVIVRDFRPKQIQCYMLQIKGFDQYQEQEFENGRLTSGVYYGIYDTKPNKTTINNLMKQIKK